MFRRESFASCSAWERKNDLPWERRDLSDGPWVGGNYTDLL